MEFQENFKMLNFELRKRKDSEERFIVLNVLDIKNNPCKFFVFNSDLVDKIVSSNFVGLQDVTILFRLSFSNMWNVNLLDIK